MGANGVGGTTHIVNNTDGNLARLLGRLGRRLVSDVCVAQNFYLSSFSLIGDLLSGPLPLVSELDLEVIL